MNVYELYTADDFKLFDLKNPERIPRLSSWKSPEVVLASDMKGFPRSLGDYSNLVTMPVFSQKAVYELGSILGNSGDLLPLTCEEVDAPYFAYNVKVRVSVEEDLSVMRKNSLGRLKWIDKPVFMPESLEDIYIFKIRQLPIEIPSVTDKFVQRVNELGLTGFYFREIWSDGN